MEQVEEQYLKYKKKPQEILRELEDNERNICKIQRLQLCQVLFASRLIFNNFLYPKNNGKSLS